MEQQFLMLTNTLFRPSLYMYVCLYVCMYTFISRVYKTAGGCGNRRKATRMAASANTRANPLHKSNTSFIILPQVRSHVCVVLFIRHTAIVDHRHAQARRLQLS